MTGDEKRASNVVFCGDANLPSAARVSDEVWPPAVPTRDYIAGASVSEAKPMNTNHTLPSTRASRGTSRSAASYSAGS